GELELVRHGEREHGEVARRTAALVGEDRGPRRVVVGMEGALGHGVGERIQAAIDGLVAEGRHAGAVRARVDERQGAPSLPADDPTLCRAPRGDALARRHWGRGLPRCPGSGKPTSTYRSSQSFSYPGGRVADPWRVAAGVP